MTYNVFGGTLNLAQSIPLNFKSHANKVSGYLDSGSATDQSWRRPALSQCSCLFSFFTARRNVKHSICSTLNVCDWRRRSYLSIGNAVVWYVNQQKNV